MTLEEIERALKINEFMQQCIELDLFDEDLTVKQQIRNLDNLVELKGEWVLMNLEKTELELINAMNKVRSSDLKSIRSRSASTQFKYIEAIHFTGER